MASFVVLILLYIINITTSQNITSTYFNTISTEDDELSLMNNELYDFIEDIMIPAFWCCLVYTG